jgi:hypothetical protein
MSGWTHNDLERMGAAEELQLATFKKDGTLRKPVVIWVVRVGDELYVRSWRGHEGAWFRHTQQRSEGRIGASGVTKAHCLMGNLPLSASNPLFLQP